MSENEVIQSNIHSPLTEQEIDFYLQALSGDKNAVQFAYDYFKKLHIENPANLDYKIHYADCLSLLAKHENEASDMIGKGISAMKLFDSVVNAKPNHIKYRYMRGYHALRLPQSFFHRTSIAIIDLEYLMNRYEENYSIFSKYIYFQLLYDLGLANWQMEDEEEANMIWEKLLSLNPPTKFEQLINQAKAKDDYHNWSLMDYSSPPLLEGKRLHDLGVKGNKQAAKLALDLWQREYESNPSRPIVQAYLGSSKALVAAWKKEPKELFGLAMEGYMDVKRAFEKEPDNLEILLLQTFIANAFPPVFFDFLDKVIEGFEKLKEAYQRDNSVFSKEQYHEILYHLGLAYERSDKAWMAKLVWGELLRDNPAIKYEIQLIGRV